MKTKRNAIHEIFNKELECLHHATGLTVHEYEIIKNDILMMRNYYELSTASTDYYNVMSLLNEYVINKYWNMENVRDYLLCVIRNTYPECIILP